MCASGLRSLVTVSMSSDYNPPQDPLEFLHDDHQVVLVNKPAGLLSVPGKGEHLSDCLMERVKAVFPTALLVHRLDRDTSGVMIFALTPHAQRHLGLQFEKRQTKKTYIARVWGEMTEMTGTVDAPIGRHRVDRVRMAIREDGRESVTHYRVLTRFRAHTHVRVMLETGRTHQIPVHLAHAG